MLDYPKTLCISEIIGTIKCACVLIIDKILLNLYLDVNL